MPLHQVKQAEAVRRCPICGKPASIKEQPFCSGRCADIDLHRWLSGAYAIPARPDAEDEDGARDEGRAKKE